MKIQAIEGRKGDHLCHELALETHLASLWESRPVGIYALYYIMMGIAILTGHDFLRLLLILYIHFLFVGTEYIDFFMVTGLMG